MAFLGVWIKPHVKLRAQPLVGGCGNSLFGASMWVVKQNCFSKSIGFD